MTYLLALINKFTVTTKHVMKSRHGSLSKGSKGQMGMGVFSILVSPTRVFCFIRNFSRS